MAGLLDQFLQQFVGGAPAGNQAAEFHQRFVSKDEKDREFDNDTYHDAATEHLRHLPDDEFQNAARSAVAHAGPEQRQDLLGGLLGALGGAGALGGMASGASGGAGLGQIAKMLGLGSTDPQQMNEDDAAKLMNYARKERPEALRQTVAEKPWFVQALGNPIVMGALTMAASRLLSRRR